MISYAIAKFMKLGLLEYNDEWYKWDFTMPPSLTIDYGREAQADREDVKAGLQSAADVTSKYGKSEEDVLRAALRRKKLKKRLEQEEGETFEGIPDITDVNSQEPPQAPPPTTP
jgi:hypothetical protein